MLVICGEKYEKEGCFKLRRRKREMYYDFRNKVFVRFFFSVTYHVLKGN